MKKRGSSLRTAVAWRMRVMDSVSRCREVWRVSQDKTGRYLFLLQNKRRELQSIKMDF